jgi:uncharacterized membrane protein YfcA
MSFIEYIEYFFITLTISSFFALGGVGGAAALIPIFDFLSLSFNMAKAIALFINTSTTITATFMNFKRGVLDIKFTLPLVISSMIFSPIGAYSSQFVDINYIKWGFVIFLFFSASMMFFSKKEAKLRYTPKWILFIIGAIVGYISGILGVGGGAIVMPIMIFLGFDTKKVAVAVSFMIPFSTFSAFLSYLSFVEINWLLLLITSFAAILGGYIGNKIMHFRLNAKQIKKIIAIMLYILAFKILYALL